MLKVKNNGKWHLVIAIIVSGIVFFGCGRRLQEKGEEAQVVARINSYELTVRDFKDEADITLSSIELSGDPLKVKEDFLEDMITKKILLQEAQKENFDKDKAFMKEIERYWEQALLKLLIKKKAAEIAKNVTTQDKDIRNEEIEEAFEAWVTDLRKNSSVKINRKVLNEIEIDRNK